MERIENLCVLAMSCAETGCVLGGDWQGAAPYCVLVYAGSPREPYGCAFNSYQTASGLARLVVQQGIDPPNSRRCEQPNNGTVRSDGWACW